MRIEFMTANARDCGLVAQMFNEVYNDPDSKRGWINEADAFVGRKITREAVAGTLSSGQIIIALGVDDDDIVRRPVGYVYLEAEGDYGFLGSLAVLPKYQGLGIGKEILAQSEKIMASQGCKYMHLFVLGLPDLIKFYEKRGYRKSGNLGEDGIELVKEL